MNEIHEDLLDAPSPTPQRFPLWAVVGALGICGIIASLFGMVTYSGMLDASIKVGDALTVPPMVTKLMRNSEIILFFGVVLTVLRKEPKSTFRTWVIWIGILLLTLIFLVVGFAYSVDVLRN
jgi:hypothetical protein